MKNFIKKFTDCDALQMALIAIGAILVLFLFCAIEPAHAQDYVRQGNKFIQVSNNTKDTLVTDYTIVDAKGVEHTIIINKTNGRCYTWRKSSKTGRMYKQYVRNDLAESIAKELNIEFKQPKKR